MNSEIKTEIIILSRLYKGLFFMCDDVFVPKEDPKRYQNIHMKNIHNIQARIAFINNYYLINYYFKKMNE